MTAQNLSRRAFLGGLLALLAATTPIVAEAAHRQRKSASGRKHKRRGCGSRGGPGYRKDNGKCAGWND